MADVFEKFIKISNENYGINPLYCVSLPGYTWQRGMNYTDIKLRTLQDEDLILTLENNIRGGISSDIGDRYVISDDNKIYCILMLIICMVGLCQNNYHMVKLNLIQMLN